MVPLCSAGRTAYRGRKPPQIRQPQHDRLSLRLRQTGSRRHTIFIHNGAPQALVGCHENDAAGGPSGGLRIGFEGDAIAEAFEASFKVCDGSGLAP